MSVDVNAYVYSTSNLLFLVGSDSQLRLVPEQVKRGGYSGAGHTMRMCKCQFENEP